jgi:hypothetical protein
MLNSPISLITRTMAVAAVCLASMALAAPPAQFASAFALFSQARVGNEAAIEQSADAFAKLLQTEPANPLWMAYSGSATSMRATTTWLPWKKMQYAEDGLALLDKALATLTQAHNVPVSGAVPVAMEVRFVAASTYLAVPGFMNKGTRGTKLLNDVVVSPQLASVPLAFRVDVWMTAADQAIKDKRVDEARKYLNQVIASGAPQAAAARQQLGALKS